MLMETKLSTSAQSHTHHSAAWQSSMDEAFATFLRGVNTQLLQAGQLKARPVVLSYADMPEESFEDKTVSLPKIADQLKEYLSAAGLDVICNAINVDAPQDSIAALKSQLTQDSDTQIIVLSTPAYSELANRQGKQLHQVLVNFGEGKKDNLLPLICLGGFSVASQIVPRHFLFRNGESAFRMFDGPQGGMSAFLDMFGDLSGKQGLGLLPDLLDLESTQSHQQPIYAALFTELSQNQARLTMDHVLEESLDMQLNNHPLHGHYPETQNLHLDASFAGDAVEEKQTGVPELLANFLSDSKSKTALLLTPTPADTELGGIAVVEMLRQQPSNPRVIAIDLAQYPGRAAHQCVALTLRHALKLAPPIIQRLQQQTLREDRPRPIVFVFKNYQHTGSYDNLYIQNALANWLDAKVVVTCSGDYFNRHDSSLCFLSDPTNPDRSSFRQITLASFATPAAHAKTMRLVRTKLDNLDALLADSGLTPKRQAQQYELDRFLTQISPLISFLSLDARNAFISYAWEPATKDLARQQHHLRQIAQDLGRVGFPTWLDIERMTGDIHAQMAQNIQSSHYAFIIGTPRYTQRATVLLNGQPTNVKREYDAILKGYRDERLEVLALSFLPEGLFDGGKADGIGKTHYPSFPDKMPEFPQFNLFGMDDFDDYIQRLADEQHGLLPQLLHLTARSPEDQQIYQTAKAKLTKTLALLPAQHLMVAQAQQDQRIYEVPQRRSLYIEARARAEHKDDSPEFSLTAHFDAFLSTDIEESKDDAVSPSQITTFVALGEGGSGKSLFAQIQYARLLEQWQAYQQNPSTVLRPDWIPVYIPLKHYVGKYEDNLENRAAGRVGQARVNTCVETALRTVYHLDDRDTAMLKAGSGQGLGVLLILDGFDELGGKTPHIYRLNGLEQWACPLKLLITSRVDYIPDPEKHKGYFATQEGSFVCNYIQPFSPGDIQRYIQLYETQVLIQQSQAQAARDRATGILTTSAGQTDTYQTLATLPGLLELVKNPFLLNLVLQGLPYLLAARDVQDYDPVTRLAIYDSFSQYWFGKEVYRLVKQDDPELRLLFEQHAERLAFQLYLNQQLSVSQKRTEDAQLWNEFFNASDPRVAKARAALPLRDAGDHQYEFMHKTLFEYFVTRHLIHAYYPGGKLYSNPIALGEALATRPPQHKVRSVAGVPLPVQDAGVFSFLGDAIATGNGSFKSALFEQITRSASAEGQAEPTTGGPLGLAAAHAATILAKTGVSMANQAWKGVQLPGADFGLASLPYIDLSGANLRGTRLDRTFLYGADLSHANLAAVRFMEYPKMIVRSKINCLALYPSQTASEDKPWIAVGQEQTVMIVDYKARKIVWVGDGHAERITCVAFSPMGNQVISGSLDRTLRLWHVEKSANGKLFLQAVLRGHERAVSTCTFSPMDNQLVVSGSMDKTLRLWHVMNNASGELTSQAVLHGHEGYVSACGFNPTGDQLVSGSDDKTLRLWHISPGSRGELVSQAVLRGHEDKIKACAFSPTGDQVVSGSEDKTLHLWHVGKGAIGELSPHAWLKGHNGVVRTCAFSPMGDQVVSGGDDKTVQLWQISLSSRGELAPQAVLHGHENVVSTCAFSPAGDQVVSGSYDRTLRLWQVEKNVAQSMFSGHDGLVTDCAFNHTGELVVSAGGWDKTLRLWQVGKGAGEALSPKAVLRGHEDYVSTCAFSPAGDQVVSGSKDSTLRLWQVEKGTSGDLLPQAVLRGHNGLVTTCVFSTLGDQMVSGSSEDKDLLIWHVRRSHGELFSEAMLCGHKAGVLSCAFSLAGDLVASGSLDKTLQVWQIKKAISGKVSPHMVLYGHGGGVTTCAFSPDGNHVVSGSSDKTLRLWQVGTGDNRIFAAQAVLSGHEDRVNTCVFSPSGNQVVSGGEDKTLRLWDISDINNVCCLQVVSWYANVNSIDIYPKSCQRIAGDLDQTSQALSGSVQVIMGDDCAGLLSLWQLDSGQLRLVGMPPQAGMANVWRSTWKTVKLAGTQVTRPIKALLEEYRGVPLEKGNGENQVQLVADVAADKALPAAQAALPPGSALLVARVGMLKPPKPPLLKKVDSLQKPKKGRKSGKRISKDCTLS